MRICPAYCLFTVFIREYIPCIKFPFSYLPSFPRTFIESSATRVTWERAMPHWVDCCHLNIFDPSSPIFFTNSTCDDRFKNREKMQRLSPNCYQRIHCFLHRPSNKQSLCLLPRIQEQILPPMLKRTRQKSNRVPGRYSE